VTPGAFQTTFKGGEDNPTGRGDIFVAKLNPDGSNWFTAPTSAAPSDVYGENLVVDAAGSLLCWHDHFAEFSNDDEMLQQSLQGGTGARGMGDAFIVKLNPAGSALEYASYIGRSRGRTR